MLQPCFVLSPVCSALAKCIFYCQKKRKKKHVEKTSLEICFPLCSLAETEHSYKSKKAARKRDGASPFDKFDKSEIFFLETPVRIEGSGF